MWYVRLVSEHQTSFKTWPTTQHKHENVGTLGITWRHFRQRDVISVVVTSLSSANVRRYCCGGWWNPRKKCHLLNKLGYLCAASIQWEMWTKLRFAFGVSIRLATVCLIHNGPPWQYRNVLPSHTPLPPRHVLHCVSDLPGQRLLLQNLDSGAVGRLPRQLDHNALRAMFETDRCVLLVNHRSPCRPTYPSRVTQCPLAFRIFMTCPVFPCWVFIFFLFLSVFLSFSLFQASPGTTATAAKTRFDVLDI